MLGASSTLRLDPLRSGAYCRTESGGPLALSFFLGVLALAAAAWALVRSRQRSEALKELQAAREREKELVQSEAGYRRLVESADDLIYTTDAEGRIVYANPAAARRSGAGRRGAGASGSSSGRTTARWPTASTATR